MTKNADIVVTGCGIISAIGADRHANLDSLMQCKSGIGLVKHLSTRHLEFPCGEVPFSNAELSEMAGVAAETYDRTTLLGLIAAREALEQSKITNTAPMGLVSSTTVAGMCFTELQYGNFLAGKSFVPFYNSHEGFASTSAIASRTGIGGFLDTVSTACSSSVNAIIMGSRLIQSGICDQVLVGGTDALSLFTLNGFNTLMILDKEWCRPFDESRAGLNLGEAAAYLVLETAESAASRGVSPLARISGYANHNDVYHQTASSPDGKGATLAMHGALAMSGLQANEIDYINAHGTATPNNDESEYAAIQNVFGDEWPLYSSTKANTGHTLAAAGAVEAVYAIQAIQNGVVFPNLNYSKPMANKPHLPNTVLRTNLEIKHVLSNSFGFGGNCSSLILSKPLN